MATEQLLSLRRVLADETLWPDDFVWDYASANRCAIGLARAVGILQPEEDLDADADDLGITDAEIEHLFSCLGIWPDTERHLRMSQVTPQHAIDYIDTLLTK